jgi:hypothetical protein
MVAAAEHATSAAHLKFVHHTRRILLGNFKWTSGAKNQKVSGARDFSTFVKGGR